MRLCSLVGHHHHHHHTPAAPFEDAWDRVFGCTFAFGLMVCGWRVETPVSIPVSAHVLEPALPPKRLEMRDARDLHLHRGGFIGCRTVGGRIRWVGKYYISINDTLFCSSSITTPRPLAATPSIPIQIHPTQPHHSVYTICVDAPPFPVPIHAHNAFEKLHSVCTSREMENA